MVIYGCSSCDLCFLIHTNTCAMKSSENVTSFGIKRDCSWIGLDKVSLKLASKNFVGSKLKPRFKIFSVLFKKKKGFPYGLLQAENIRSLRSARCSRVVLSKLLAAPKMSKFFISARARKKVAVLGMLANARKDHSSPLKLTR